MSEFHDQHVPKILIVDDSLSDILVMQKSLAGLGDIYNAASGNQAIQQLDLVKPEIVLLDIEMPDVNGLEICQSIRDNPELNATRIIFVTGHEDDHTEYLSFKSGADDYLVKPYNMNICRFRVQNQIRMYSLSRQSQVLMAILDALPGSLSVWTEDGHCLCANDAFFQQFGLKLSARAKLSINQLLGEALGRELQHHQAVQEPKPISYSGQQDEPVSRLEGEVRWQLSGSENIMVLIINELNYTANDAH